MATPENKPPILHILVVGFHHKLGCQVEFSYPPIIAGTAGKNECPSGWKYLPTLALPDGSHNFVEDTVFFNLPSLLEPTESIYGVSCYRQIPVEKLKIRTADVTRSTVQKSVCILSRLPIYGYIEVKLSLIADAFFDQGDFSCTELLVKAYQQLNACLLDDDSGAAVSVTAADDGNESPPHRRLPLRHYFVGLSLREITLQWRHKTLILLKLFLLQRRVVCFGSPVRGMCALILGIASLIPRLLEKGFQEVACVRTSRPLSPMPDFTDSLQREAAALQQPEGVEELPSSLRGESEELVIAVPAGIEVKVSPDTASCAEAVGDEEEESTAALVSSAASAGASGDTSPQSNSNSATESSTRELQRLDSAESGSGGGGGGTELGKRIDRSNSLTREASVDTLASTLFALSSVNPDEYRAPISIFASGNLCLPYLSLPYMDLLTDPSVLSYVIGTSNVLFQQKRQLADVLVDIENANMDAAHDSELRRQLVLSTEDLRFMDFMMKHVNAPKEDAEGSEHWIREQFQGYILALLRTAVAGDVTPKDNDHFNAHFMQAFKRTQCFQEWYDVRPDVEFFESLPSGHPFAGTLSVADMKLKIAQTMQNSESGRKINQAVNNTSRAVGGAISQAKGAFSNWWSSITTAPPQTTTNGGGSNDDTLVDAAGVASTSAAAGATATSAQQAQEISVTFQNRSCRNHLAEIEEGVSIHIDEAKQVKNNTSSGSSSGAGSEKPIDSAEELEEDDGGSGGGRGAGDGAAANLNDSKAPSEAEEAQVALLKQPPQQQQRQGEGIVEIGHEAELLDKSNNTATPQLPAPTCGTDVAAASAERTNNGDVFIV